MNLSFKKLGIIVTNLATAFLHLSLFPQMGPDPIALNGLGYLGLLGAYFMPMPMLQKNHKMVWWGMFGYTALTIVLWVILGDKNFVAGTSSATGYYAKAAEVFLMAFLWADKE
ncbi:MAG: hypothetical protein AB1607_07650 [Chloroflexota bacterium]